MEFYLKKPKKKPRQWYLDRKMLVLLRIPLLRLTNVEERQLVLMIIITKGKQRCQSGAEFSICYFVWGGEWEKVKSNSIRLSRKASSNIIAKVFQTYLRLNFMIPSSRSGNWDFQTSSHFVLRTDLSSRSHHLRLCSIKYSSNSWRNIPSFLHFAY